MACATPTVTRGTSTNRRESPGERLGQLRGRLTGRRHVPEQGYVTMPSKRTVTSRVSSGSFHTMIWRTSAGPMTYSDVPAPGR